MSYRRPYPSWRRHLPPGNAYASWGPPTCTLPGVPGAMAKIESSGWNADNKADGLTPDSSLGSAAARTQRTGSSSMATPNSESDFNAVAPAAAASTTFAAVFDTDAAMVDEEVFDEITFTTAAEAAFLAKLHARTVMLTSDYPDGDAENDRRSTISLPAYANSYNPGYSVVRQTGPRRVFGELTVVIDEDALGSTESCSHLHAHATTTAHTTTSVAGTDPASWASTTALPQASASVSVQAPQTVPWPRPRSEAMDQMS